MSKSRIEASHQRMSSGWEYVPGHWSSQRVLSTSKTSRGKAIGHVKAKGKGHLKGKGKGHQRYDYDVAFDELEAWSRLGTPLPSGPAFARVRLGRQGGPMKKVLIIAIVVLGVGVAAGPASATDFGMHGAYWNTDQAERTFGFGAKLRFSFVELRGTYFDDVTSDVEPESADFEIKVYPLEAGLVIQFLKDSTFRPYIGGGAGYYVLDTNIGDADDEIGYYLVGGADIGAPSSRVAISIEAIYRNIEGTVRGQLFDPDFDIEEDEIDLDLSGIGANAGVVFRF